MFQNNPLFFQTCQIWLNTNRQKFNSMCTALILSCDLSDPIRTFWLHLIVLKVFCFQAIVLKISSDYFLDFIWCVPAKQWKTTLSIFFQTCQIWLNTNRQKFNSTTCTVLILSCDMSDPIRSFLLHLIVLKVFCFQAVVLKIG